MRPIFCAGDILARPQRRRAGTRIFFAECQSFHFAKGTPVPSLVAIASCQQAKATARSFRPCALPCQFAKTGSLRRSDAALRFRIFEDDADTAPAVSVDDLCHALLTSAQDNDLPVPFGANLLWQESGLREDIVSSKGAMGIAQFMPEVAAEKGLNDPFDPLQAIPASARLLRELRLQFGNLGFVAAAYNAGAHRVSQWLEHRRSCRARRAAMSPTLPGGPSISGEPRRRMTRH